MGKNRQSTATNNRADGLLSCDLLPGYESWPPRGNPQVERVLDILGLAEFNESAGDMRTADGSGTGDFANAVGFDVDPKSAQFVDYTFDANRPQRRKLGKIAKQVLVLLVNEVAENVRLMTVSLGAQLEAGNDRDSQSLAFGLRVRKPFDCVMVGQAQKRETPPLGLLDQFGGGLRAI